jgi:hypothetical protein
MTVKAWTNGRRHRTGAGYGIRIARADRDIFFKPIPSIVIIDLPNGKRIQRPPSDSFSDGCIEIRDKEIGKWLISRGHATWPYRQPPAFSMIQVKSNHFQII